MRRIWFAFESAQGYSNAAKVGRTVDWTKANPQHWDQMTRIIKYRREHGK